MPPITDISRPTQGAVVAQLGFGADVASLDEFNITLSYLRTTHSFNTCARWTFVALTDSQTLYSRLKAEFSKATPRVNVRMGTILGGVHQWWPWQSHVLLNFTAKDDNQGYILSLATTDMLHLLERSVRVRAYQGTPGSVIQEIAAMHGVEAIVEATSGDGGELHVQPFQSDLDFILGRMLPRSSNSKGMSNYKLFMRDGILHYHTVPYGAVTKKLAYDGSSHVTAVYLHDTTHLLSATTGVAGVTIASHDPYTGESRYVRSSADLVLNYAGAVSRVIDASDAHLVLTHHVGENRVKEPRLIAQYNHELAHSNAYRVSMVANNTPHVAVGDILDLKFTSRAGINPWSGTYAVGGVTQALSDAALMSTIHLLRGELGRSSRRDSRAVDEDVPDHELTATGSKLSIIEAGQESAPEDIILADGAILRRIESD